MVGLEIENIKLVFFIYQETDWLIHEFYKSLTNKLFSLFGKEWKQYYYFSVLDFYFLKAITKAHKFNNKKHLIMIK